MLQSNIRKTQMSIYRFISEDISAVTKYKTAYTHAQLINNDTWIASHLGTYIQDNRRLWSNTVKL